MPSLEADSDMLATTPQSLRSDVAVKFLTPYDLPLLKVAARVGVSEVSTFHCAFKGWMGLTLGLYRQAHNEPAEAEALVG